MKKSFVTKIKEAGQSFMEMFREYPVTFTVIWILAIVATISNNVSYENAYSDLFETLYIGLGIMCAQSLFVEEHFFKERRPERLSGIVYPIGEAAALIISAVGTYLVRCLSDDKYDLVVENFEKLLAVYCCCLVAMSIYHMYRRQQERFETYCIKVCCGCFKCTILYGLFAIGIAVIVLIFEALIADTGDFLWLAEQFLAIGVYGPMLLSVFCNAKEEITKFTRLVFVYLLQSLLVVAFVIVYIYIFKIIFTMTLPSNEVFDILAFLFALGMPVWTMSMAFNETEYENKFSLAAKYLPYAYMPFIVLECICIGIRIGTYGVTLDRYLAVALIVFEVLYFAVYILQKIRDENLVGISIPVAVVMSIFIVLVPGVNAFDTSIRSQMARLDEMMRIEEPTDDDKCQIAQLYSTIRSMGEKGKLKISRTYSEADQDRLEEYNEFRTYGGEVRESTYISISESAIPRDISRYSTMLEVFSESDETSGGFHVFIINEDFDCRINVDEYVNYVAKDFGDSDEYYNDYYSGELFEIDDNTGFFCRSGFIVIDEETGKVTNCSLEGYLFME